MMSNPISRSVSPVSRLALAAALLVLLAPLTPASHAGSLDVNAGAAFSGNFGLEVTPGSACVLPERVDLDSQIVIVDVDACSFLTAVDTVVSGGGPVDFTAGVSLLLAAREDDGTVVETPFGEEVMLPAGYNLIEIDWMAGAGTGRLLVSLNGTPFGGLLGLTNGQARIDRVRWGVTDGDVDATSGSLDQDDFSSTQ